MLVYDCESVHAILHNVPPSLVCTKLRSPCLGRLVNTDQLLLHMEFISITFSATISHCFLTDGLQDMLAPQGAPDQNLCRDSQVSQGNARGSE